MIAFSDITKMEKKNTAMVIPNAIEIIAREHQVPLLLLLPSFLTMRRNS